MSPKQQDPRRPARQVPIAFLTLLLLAGLYGIYRYSMAAQPAVDSSVGQEAASEAPAPRAAALELAANSPSRTPIEASAAAPAPAAAHSSEDPISPDELRGRVVDSELRPLTGASVSLRRGEVRDFNVLDPELNAATESFAATTTDTHGEFRFEVPRGIPFDLHVEGREFCPRLLPDRHAGEYLVVQLSAGFSVFGRVTRETDGAPVVDAKVRVFRRGGPPSLARETRTAGNGGFDLRFDFREAVMLEIVPAIEQCPPSMELELGAETRIEKNVAVREGFLVVGKVSVAGSDQPIPGAIVGEGWTFKRSAVTDANGEYRLNGFGNPGVAELHAKARGFGKTQRQDLPGAEAGVMRVDFWLTPARAAHGRVVDASGSAVHGVLAAAIASEFAAQGQRTDWIAARSDASGRFELESLTPELPHALLLSKQGFATSVYDFPATEFSTQDLDLGTFVLGPPALIAGTVVDDAGLALADTEVVLKGFNADRFRLSGEERKHGELIGDWYTDTRISRSDARGRFSFGELSAGSYSLQARLTGRPSSPSVQVALAEAERREAIELVLATGSRLRGRVLDPEGRPVPGTYLSVEPLAPRATSDRSDRSSATRSDAEGRFEFLGLKAGDYRLHAQPWLPEDRDSDTPLLPTYLKPVATDASELTLVLPRGATIRGTLRDAQGAALFGYSIVAASGEDRAPIATTDANGEFKLAVLQGSSTDLEVRGSPGGASWEEVFLVERSVVAGTRGLELRLP